MNGGGKGEGRGQDEGEGGGGGEVVAESIQLAPTLERTILHLRQQEDFGV